jgi:hypothetical protein
MLPHAAEGLRLPLPQGYLFPLYHKHYWIGLTSNASAYPRFSWIDVTNRPPGVAGSYKHWGACLSAAHSCS